MVKIALKEVDMDFSRDNIEDKEILVKPPKEREVVNNDK